MDSGLKTKHFVRQSLFFILISLACPAFSCRHAEAETLPAIDARQLGIIPKEVSRSGRIYRFKLENAMPRTGNVLLIQIGDRPIMAFRVLKSDEASKEIIAKRIRRYDQEGKLELEKRYLAAEKIADLVPPPAPSEALATAGLPPTAGLSGIGATPQAGARTAGEPSIPTEGGADMTDESSEAITGQEPPDPNAPALLGDDGSGGPEIQGPITAKSVEEFDEELDASTSPRNLKNESTTRESDTSGGSAGPGIEEHSPLIKYEHMIGISVGSFRNMSGFSFPGITNNGFTAYYNEIIDRDLWFKGYQPQDALSLEAGLGYYSRVNLSGTFDNYDVIPIRAELLYTLQLSETFAALGHVGAQFNWVVAADNASEAGLASISGIQPNLGAGILYNIGPQWYLRCDAGLDRIAIGLAVKW